MSKNLVLMRDVICVYHPKFRRSKDLQSYGLEHSDIFNCERLVEESLAAAGGYKFVDEDGYDFSDYSDSKTASVQPFRKGISVSSIENKIGDLRITIYNPFENCLAYVFMPYNEWQYYKEADYGKNCQKQRLRTTWNQSRNHYNLFEDYRLGSFKELAQA